MDYAYIKQRIIDLRIEKGVSEYQMSLDVSVNSRLIKEHTGLPQMVGRRYKINICLLQMHCPRTHPRHYLWHTGMLRPSSRNR